MAKVAKIKTQQTVSSVQEFIDQVENEQQRKDSLQLIAMMKKASGEEPKMWGTSLVGFGLKRYKSPATGREVDWFLIGFSPRKGKLSLHLVFDINKYAGELEKLGKYKTGVGCLYINKLSDIDIRGLEKLMQIAIKSK